MLKSTASVSRPNLAWAEGRASYQTAQYPPNLVSKVTDLSPFICMTAVLMGTWAYLLLSVQGR
jgi:hypothetical protein